MDDLEAFFKVTEAINPSVPVLIYSGMSENVQSFKRKREREREDKRKRKRERERERERVDRLDAICKRKIKERGRERERVRVKC